MERRSFLARATATAAALGLPASAWAAGTKTGRLPQRKTIRPNALKPGDTIGIIAPASYVEKQQDIDDARKAVEGLGFKTVIGDHLNDRFGYLAGTDRNRAEDVNAMFRRTDVQGIIAVRGGWGCLRMIPYLDYEMIRRHPKVILGYSDITTVLNAIYLRTGLVTFHGPVAISTFNDYTNEYLRKAVLTPTPIGLVAPPPRSANGHDDTSIVSLGTGRGTGPLVGGNLSLIVTMLGTPFEIDLRGKVLFLEEVDEEPYRVDRMLTHLWLAGHLQKLAGLVIGKFSNCVPKKENPEYPVSFTVEELFQERIVPLGIPAIAGVMIGHISSKLTVPIGARATVDADAKTFTIIDAAVA
jgi:muramoyltetrapeptide carboxypeptidase